MLYYVLSALAVLIILTIHEYFHAFAAHKLGDDTAKDFGRMTFNPLKHLDPIGAICMVLFHFGWAKPVPVNTRNLKKPRRDFALIALAGPASNLLMGFLLAPVYILIFRFYNSVEFPSAFLDSIVANTLIFVQLFFSINVGLAIFNLIPVPPLDGSRLATAYLPPKAYYKVMQYERRIYFIFIGWLLLGSYVSRALLSIPFIGGTPVLAFFARIFSLSDILSYAVSKVASLILAFWQLFI